MEMGKFKQYRMMAPHDTTLPKDLLIFIYTPKLTDIPAILLVKGQYIKQKQGGKVIEEMGAMNSRQGCHIYHASVQD